jgi:hypothetical protein
MRCIDECGYQHKPDNLTVLTRHVEECLAEGACGKLGIEPVVIWKDGQFNVVAAPTDKRKKIKDTSFEITLIKKEPVEVTEDMKKSLREVNEAQRTKPKVTMGSISDTMTAEEKRTAKRKRAELKDDGFI